MPPQIFCCGKTFYMQCKENKHLRLWLSVTLTAGIFVYLSLKNNVRLESGLIRLRR